MSLSKEGKYVCYHRKQFSFLYTRSTRYLYFMELLYQEPKNSARVLLVPGKSSCDEKKWLYTAILHNMGAPLKWGCSMCQSRDCWALPMIEWVDIWAWMGISHYQAPAIARWLCSYPKWLASFLYNGRKWRLSSVSLKTVSLELITICVLELLETLHLSFFASGQSLYIWMKQRHWLVCILLLHGNNSSPDQDWAVVYKCQSINKTGIHNSKGSCCCLTWQEDENGNGIDSVKLLFVEEVNMRQ